MKVKPDFKKLTVSKFSVIFYWLLIIALLGLFFTNDFGLVDIHKTAIISAVGIDTEDGEVLVTCEVAVPQPSQSGDNIKYTQIQGSGLTIADAMNEVNSKTGFYPQLQYCRLVLVGESCKDVQLFRLLGCFYRKNYSELTALVAMCKGKASEMLSYKSPVSDMTSETIRKCISEEIEKSANAVTVNLKDIASLQFSKNKACYMPYVEANIPGTSESGGNGENVGGESGGQSQGGQGGQSGGQSQGGGGEGGSQSQGGASGQSQQGEQTEFTAARTAVFADGMFKTFLDEKQTLALNLLKGDLDFVSLPFDTEDKHYSFRLKNTDGGIGLKIENGVPKVSLKFKAKANVQGAREIVNPSDNIDDDVVPEAVLKAAEEEVKGRFINLMDVSRREQCDFLGLKDILFKFNYKYYDAMNAVLLDRAEVMPEVNIGSIN